MNGFQKSEDEVREGFEFVPLKHLLKLRKFYSCFKEKPRFQRFQNENDSLITCYYRLSKADKPEKDF